MTLLKCKICGGSIRMTKDSCGVCESCGNEVTLPALDDEKRIFLYNRANAARQSLRFEEAAHFCEELLAYRQDDAELYWQRFLCRYGIEYVYDRRIGQYRPIFHRINRSAVAEDPDFQKALTYANAYTRQIYRNQASYLGELQEQILATCGSLGPCDVFLCYRSEENGQTAADGEELRKLLSSNGVRVFSPVHIPETALWEEHEAYIFSALHSAKMMIIVSDHPRDFEDPIMRNAWLRYAQISREEAGREILIAHRSLHSSELPHELRAARTVDLTMITAKQDILYGTLRLLGKGREADDEELSEEEVVAETLLKLILKSLQEGRFDEAEKRCIRLEKAAPECALAYLYHCFAQCKVCELEALPKQVTWMQDPEFANAMKYADEELYKRLRKFLDACATEQLYLQAVDDEEEGCYEDAIESFRKLGSYRDSAKHLERCKKLLHEQIAYREAKNAFEQETAGKDAYLHMRLKDTAELKRFEELQVCCKRERFGRKFRMMNLLCTLGATVLLCVSSGASGWLSLLLTIVCAWLLGCAAHGVIRDEGEPAEHGVSAGFAVLLIIVGAIVEWLISPRADNIFFLLCGGILILFFLARLFCRIRYSGSQRKKDEHYVSSVLPLQKALVQDIEQRYIGDLGAATIRRLLAQEIEKYAQTHETGMLYVQYTRQLNEETVS